MIFESGIMVESPVTRMNDALYKAADLYERRIIGIEGLASLQLRAERQCREELRARLAGPAAVRAFGVPHWAKRQQLLAKSRAGLAAFHGGGRSRLALKSAGALEYKSIGDCRLKSGPADVGVPDGPARFGAGGRDIGTDDESQGRSRLSTRKGTGSDAFVIKGAAYGNVDRQGDVCEPGCVSNISEFLDVGWIALLHDGERLPIGVPLTASQDSRGFWVSGQWHSTDQAQEARAVCEERISCGKTVAASIGYRIDPDGAAMEERDGQSVRVLKSISVYEVSLVLIPANTAARFVSAG